jgi:hypothetical protein
VCSFAFGVIGHLDHWPVLGGGFAIIFGIVFAHAFALFNGGIATIEHYVLRWHLWRDRAIPWNYTRFLDDAAKRILLRKVGGGYMFIHRSLLDYFANLPIES